ncbi:MAG: hypothetical protein ACRDZT_06515, partial [Acidimicrobiales bacterium]
MAESPALAAPGRGGPPDSPAPSPSRAAVAASETPDWGTTMLRRLAPPALAVLAYLAIAALAYWPVEPFSRSHLVGCACSDPAQETWFLAWPAYALLHARNPFFTSYLEYPHGVNLALNTSMPLLGILGAPITWIRGPVAAFNALLRLSLAASATSMLFVVRRFTRWWPAAFGAGLLYGFSPYMVGQGFGHLFLTFVPLPPLIGLCLYDICQAGGRAPRGEAMNKHRKERRPALLGLVLAVLCLLQYFISIEVLATTAVCFGVVLVAFALTHVRAALARSPSFFRAIAVGLAVFLPVIAYPTWFFLRGPQHVAGPPHTVAGLAAFKADLLGAVVPTMNQRLGPAHLIAVGTSYGAGDRPENGVYLGLLLAALLLFILLRCRRERLVQLGGAVLVIGLVLSLGSRLSIDNHTTGISLPFELLTRLPLIQGVEALRFSLYEQLGAALILGVGLDRLRREGWSPSRTAGEREGGSSTGRPGWLRAAPVGLVAVAALLPLFPRYPYPSGRVVMPEYFTSAAVRAIRPGSVVLTYPYDESGANYAMLWQAASGMRFKILGGQASTPGPGDRATSTVAALP